MENQEQSGQVQLKLEEIACTHTNEQNTNKTSYLDVVEFYKPNAKSLSNSYL
jgi:hypothetical protein